MPQPRERAEALSELLEEVTLTSFRLQAEAEQLAGGLSRGTLGVLRTLFEDGPRTVAEIARSRPVARQGVQRNADALAERGLVSYADNPRHRRSKLLVLTTRGEKACRRARDAQLAWAAWIDDGSESQLALQNAARVLRWCRQVLAAGPR